MNPVLDWSLNFSCRYLLKADAFLEFVKKQSIEIEKQFEKSIDCKKSENGCPEFNYEVCLEQKLFFFSYRF